MNLQGILATKPVADYQKEASDKTLVRALGIPALIAFGIGGIIGTGIFVLPGLGEAEHAGPAIVFSFVIAGIGCMFAGLCYSEFAAMVPVAGSAYAYSYATLGEFVAWFVGWNLILEYMVTCSTVAVGWSRYFIKLLDHFGINFIPASLSSAPFEAADVGYQVHMTGAIANLPAIVIIGAATALCYKGIKESATVNPINVAIKVAIVMDVIAFGASFVDTHNWVPYIPKNTGTFGQFGWSGILQASAIIFFAYIGFDGVSTVAQEAKDPQRGMPIGMLGSLTTCTVLYILMSSVMTGLSARVCGSCLAIGMLGELVSIGAVFVFIVVCDGVLVMRYTRSDLKGPFRVKWIWFVSLMGVLFCAAMAASLTSGTWLRLI